MKTFQPSASIDASAERVWALLTGVARWPAWNTTIDKVEGQAALGATVTVYTKLSPKRAFPVTVAELDAPRRMLWRGRYATRTIRRHAKFVRCVKAAAERRG